jgi:Tfp pilus assembly protein PilX
VRKAEQGFVMVVVMVVLMVVLTVSGVVIFDTVGARSFTTKDQRADAAQQAADAGLQLALYRANKMDLGKTDFNSGLGRIATTLSCFVPGLGVDGYVNTSFTRIAIGAGTSCPTPGGTTNGAREWKYERLGNRTTVATIFLDGRKTNTTSNQNTTGHVSLNPVIVAVGREDNGTTTTSDDIVRRAEAILNPYDPFDMVEATGNLTFNNLLTTALNGDVRTNGNLSVSGLIGVTGLNVLASDGSILRTASAEYGGNPPSGSLFNVANLVHTNTPFVRAPISISPSKVQCGTTAPAGACPSGYPKANQALTLTSGQSLTLGAGDYVFCSVSVAAGATLNTSTSATSPTRIFIDSPQSTRCSSSSGTGNLTLNGTLNTVSLSPSTLQIYMTGNGTPGGTTASINTSLISGTPAFFLYAPDTDVDMRFLLFQGNVIGHDVTMRGACVIGILGLCISGTDVLTQDLNLYNMPLSSSVGVLTRKQYIQCEGYEPPASTPTVNC